MKRPIKKVVKNDELKEHLEKQDNTLNLLEKAVNQIVELLQDNAVKINHLFTWKERERVKQSRVSFKAANVMFRIVSILGYLLIISAVIYGGYKLFNWVFYG